MKVSRCCCVAKIACKQNNIDMKTISLHNCGATFLIILLFAIQPSTGYARFKCEDAFGTAECTLLSRQNYCNQLIVKWGCAQSCQLCNKSLSWSRWTHWSECSARKCGTAGRRTRVRLCETIQPCIGSTIDVQSCVRTACIEETNGEICDPTEQFLCPGGSVKHTSDCRNRTWLCDGFKDCTDNADEVDCLLGGGPTDEFVTTDSIPQCLHANKKNVSLPWHCGTPIAPYYHEFRWKWHGFHNLRNVKDGRCLAVNGTTRAVEMTKCDSNNIYQHWQCSTDGGLEIPKQKRLTERFLTYERSTGKMIVTSTKDPDVKWKLFGTKEDICSEKRRWSEWSEWSGCSSSCIAIGYGVRTRSRTCKGGDPGRGLCFPPAVEAKSCSSTKCLAQCPPGFSSATYPWSCVKLITEQPLNLTDARKSCHNMKSEGVSLNAVLASDKDIHSHEILKNLSASAGVKRFYVGGTASIVNGEIEKFSYASDGGLVGDLSASRHWHDVWLNLTGGWSGSNGAFAQIVSGTGYCLSINATSKRGVMEDCYSDATYWVESGGLLMHLDSGLCLGRDQLYSGSSTSVVLFGEACDMKDPKNSLKWRLNGKYIVPKGTHLMLTAKDGDELGYREQLVLEWYAETTYNGLTDMFVTRDWYGKWFTVAIKTDGLCLTVIHDVEVNDFSLKRVACSQEDAQQRWSFLWSKHLVNRHHTMCLAVNISRGSRRVNNDTSVLVAPCIVTERSQIWRRVLQKIGGTYYSRFYPIENSELTLQSKCKPQSPDASGVCVAKTDENDGLLTTKYKKSSITGEIFMLHSRIINIMDLCLQVNPLNFPVNDTPVGFGFCTRNVQGGSWWRWSAAGTAIVNHACSVDDCCLTATLDDGLVLRNCTQRLIQRDQMWRIVKGKRGFQLILLKNPTLFMGMELPFVDFAHSNLISIVLGLVAPTMINMNESYWFIKERNGGQGNVSGLTDCWKKGDKDFVYKGSRSWTENAVRCQAWRRQAPHGHTYPSDGPYCRSPPSFRPDGSRPWCLTVIPTKRWESCRIPECPTQLGVALSSDDGLWAVTGGSEKLPYACEVHPECIYGHGFDYKGTINSSWTGRSCMNWLERQIKLRQTDSGIIAPNHTFCRNPNREEGGPWCWVSDFEKEYCKHILKCPVRCSDPPTLFRGYVHGIFHAGSGVMYANKTTILYACNRGFIRSTPNTTYDLMCVNGTWLGSIPTCEITSCTFPNPGVCNAEPLFTFDIVIFNKPVVYNCKEGFVIDKVTESITLTCSTGNTWSTEKLPERLVHLDNTKITDVSKISCISSCYHGFTQVGQWCTKVNTIKDFYAGDSDSDQMRCDAPSRVIPLEAALSLDMHAMLKGLARERFKFNAEWTPTQFEKLDDFRGLTFNQSIFRSSMSGKIFEPEVDYVPSRFMIKSITHIRISFTEFKQYCAAAFTPSVLVPAECPEDFRNETYLFRWISEFHILHLGFKLCLTATGIGATVRLEPCSITNYNQHWNCEDERIFFSVGKFFRGVMHFGFYKGAPFLSTRSHLRVSSGANLTAYANKFYAGDYLVTTLGLRRHMGICSGAFKPSHEFFFPLCYKENPLSLLDTRPCSLTPPVDHVCPYYNADYDVRSTGIGRLLCVRRNEVTVRAWKGTITVGSWCLAMFISFDSLKSQVMETPCSLHVTENICVMKALHSCSSPALRIRRGYRVSGNDSTETVNLIYSISNASSAEPTSYARGSVLKYRCDAGYRFSDGTVQQSIVCLKSGSWSREPTSFKCIPRYCYRPNDPAYARPLFIPKNTTQLNVGTTLQVSCLTGYVIKDDIVARSSICNPNGDWDPPIVSCRPMSCTPPPSIDGMSISGNVFRLHGTITYKCKFGTHFILPSGESALESFHKCDATGSWVPDPSLLQCVETTCPDPVNILSRTKSGPAQVATIGCTGGESLFDGSVPVRGGKVTALCNPHGSWEPNIANLRCDYTRCPLPISNIQNARMIRWSNNLPGKRDDFRNPVHQAKAELFCNAGFHQMRHFSIYNGVPVGDRDEGCLGANVFTNRVTLSLLKVCKQEDDPTLLWQWWPYNNSLLMNVVTGMCLTSSLPAPNIRRNGYGNVTLESCYAHNKRQQWTCYTHNGKNLYVGLLHQEHEADGEVVLLRYSAPLQSVVVSTSLSLGISEWKMSEGSAICVMKSPDMKTEIKCSATGVWVPDASKIGCVPTVCQLPANETGIIFHSATSARGARIPWRDAYRGLAYGSTVVATCAEGYKVRDPYGEGRLSTVVIKCSAMQQWNPTLRYMHCEPIVCESLAGKIANARLKTEVDRAKKWQYLSSVTVICKTGLWFEDAGIRSPTLTLDCGKDGAWGWPPAEVICKPVACASQPRVPAHASIISRGGGHSYNDARIMRCSEGYWFGRDRHELIVRCLDDGRWHPSLDCKEVTCVDPPSYISFGRMLTETRRGWEVGASAIYMCTDHRLFHGTDNVTTTVTCEVDGLWFPDPKTLACTLYGCLSVEKMQKLNPNSAMAGGHTTVGATLNVSCEGGYVMRNGLKSVAITCRSDRRWFPPLEAIQCLPVSCGGNPPDIPRAKTIARTGYAYGSVATVTCDQGYIMQGVNAILSVEVKCNISGFWNPDPRTLNCTSVTCIDPKAQPNTIFTRTNRGGRQIAVKGDTAMLSCTHGFWLEFRVYELVLTCSDTGLWDPHPSSVPCIPINCFDPGLLHHSSRQLVGSLPSQIFILSSSNIDTSKGFKYMQQLEYKCSPGYWVAQGITEQRTLCQQNGEWTQTTGTLRPCVPKSCAKLPVVQNADIVAVHSAHSGVHSHGVEITYKCRTGFYFEGGQVTKVTTGVTCTLGGLWNPAPSKLRCIIVTCPRLNPLYRNDSSSISYGSIVIVTCPIGYVLDTRSRKNSETLTCTATGEWEPNFVKLCERLSCRKPPDYLNAKSRPVQSSDYLFGTIWQVVCQKSYSVSLKNNSWDIRCSDDRTWQPDDLQCVRDNFFRCDLPPRVPFARRVLQPRYLHDSNVTYVCFEDYWMAGKERSQTSICVKGVWVPDPSNFACHPVTCPLPTSFPTNTFLAKLVGKQQAQGVTAAGLAPGQKHYEAGAKLTIQCTNGYWMPDFGLEIVSVCGRDGFLPEITELQCTAAICTEILPTIAFATFTIHMNGLKAPEAKYRCADGYIFSTSQFTRTRDFTTSCDGGVWVPSPKNRLCVPLMCLIPPDISFGFYSSGSIYYKDTVTYSCLSGFKFTSGKTTEETTCNDHGLWDPDPVDTFSCVVIDCGVPMKIPLSTVTYESATHLKTAVYTCNHGLKIYGQPSNKATVKCESDTRWTPHPVNAVRCVNGTCSGAPPIVNNTQHAYGFTHYGATWTYECKTGFHVSSGQRHIRISCNYDGTWSRPQGKCIKSTCGTPPYVDKAKIADYKSYVDASGASKQNVTYRCHDGTWISNGIYKSFTTKLVCDDGEWSPKPEVGIRCVMVTCDVLPTPRVQQGLAPPSISRTHPEEAPQYMAKVIFECPYGQFIKAYRLRKLSIDCQKDGRWSRDITNLFCEETSCPDFYNDTNAVWTHRSLFSIGAKSELTCLPTFWITKRVSLLTMTCTENGRWEPEEKCLPIECPDPGVEHSWYNVTHKTRTDVRFPVMSQVNFTCFNGYTILASTKKLICELSGEWNPSHTTVRCRPITCPMPLVTDTALLVGARTYNSTLFVKCKLGFMVTNGITFKGARCQTDGTWDNDLASVVCFPIICHHSSIIDNGTLISASRGPNYHHRDIVRVTCLKGYWTDRNIRQFSSLCSDTGLWFPPLDDVKCTRISCIEPLPMASATKQFSSLIANSRLRYVCDPIHWIATLRRGRGENPFDRWIIGPEQSFTLVCLEGGEWHYEAKDIRCLSTKVANTFRIRNELATGALTTEQVEVLPIGNYVWLSREAIVAVNDPGIGTELGEWIERVEGGERGRLFKASGMEELREALEDESYRVIVEDVLRSTPFTSINCSNEEEKDFIPSNMTEDEIKKYVPMVQVDPVRKCKALSKLRLLRRARMLKTLPSKILTEKIERVLDFRYSRIMKMSSFGRTSHIVKEYAALVGSNDSFLYDGDPLTTWTPNQHAISWQFEFHLGELYLIDEVMIMTTKHVVFNLTFSPNNQSFRSNKFFPIDTRQPTALGEYMEMTVLSSAYGLTTRMRNFGKQKATLIHFSFDLPPFIREVNFHGARAEWRIVVPLTSMVAILIATASTFFLLLPVLMIFDYRHAKECTVQWFGGLNDGIPCVIKIQTASSPKVALDLYVRVVTSRRSSTPVAWVKMPALKRGVLSNNLTIGFFTPRPETNHVGVYIACNASDLPEGVTEEKKLTKWEVEKVAAVCAGRQWSNQGKTAVVSIQPFQRFGFSLELQKRKDHDRCTSWLTVYAQHHMLTLVRPLRSLFSYQYLTLTQRLFSVVASIAATILIMIVLHVYTDVAASPVKGEAWYQNSFVSISTHSGICLIISFSVGVAILLFLRFLLVAFSKHERYMKLCGKARTAVLRLPGKSLYNVIMTGYPSLKAFKTGSGFASHLLPSHSTMMAWLMERNFWCLGVYKSRSAPFAVIPSSGVTKVDETDKPENRPEVKDIISMKSTDSKSAETLDLKSPLPSVGCVPSKGNKHGKRISTAHNASSSSSSTSSSSSSSLSGSSSSGSSGSGSVTSTSGSTTSSSGSASTSGSTDSTAKKKTVSFDKSTTEKTKKAALEEKKKSGKKKKSDSSSSSPEGKSSSEGDDDDDDDDDDDGSGSSFTLPKVKKKKKEAVSSSTMETSLHTSDMTVDSSTDVILADKTKIIADIAAMQRGAFRDNEQMGDGLRTEMKSYIVSRPTASQLSLAVGRRTIFPQREEVVTQSSLSDFFFSFTAGSLVLGTMGVLTSITLVVSYLLVNGHRTGPEAKFLLDGVVLITVGFLFLGTALEGAIVSLLIYCGLVEHDIDFEGEVNSIMKKYQHTCSKLCTENVIDQKTKPSKRGRATDEQGVDKQIQEAWKKHNEKHVEVQAGAGLTQRQARLRQTREAILRCGATIGPCRTRSCPGKIPCYRLDCSIKHQAQKAACCAEIQVEIESSDTHSTPSEGEMSEASQRSMRSATREDNALLKSYLPCEKVSKWIGGDVKWMCVTPKYKPLRPGKSAIEERMMLPLEHSLPQARRTYCRTADDSVEAATYQTVFNLPPNVCDVCETGNVSLPPTFYSEQEHVDTRSKSQISNTVKLSAFSSTRINGQGKEMLMVPRRFPEEFKVSDRPVSGKKDGLHSLEGSAGRISKQNQGKYHLSPALKEKLGASQKKKSRGDDDDGHQSLQASQGTTPSPTTTPSQGTNRNSSSRNSSGRAKPGPLKRHARNGSTDWSSTDTERKTPHYKKKKYHTGPESEYSSESRYESAGGGDEFSPIGRIDVSVCEGLSSYESDKSKLPTLGRRISVSVLTTKFDYSRYENRFIDALKDLQKENEGRKKDGPSSVETGLRDAMKLLRRISEHAKIGKKGKEFPSKNLAGYSEREKGYVEAFKVLHDESGSKSMKDIAQAYERIPTKGFLDQEKGFLEAMNIINGMSDDTTLPSSTSLTEADSELRSSAYTHSDHERGFIRALKVMRDISEDKALMKEKSGLQKKDHKRHPVRVHVAEHSAGLSGTEDPSTVVSCKVTSKHKLKRQQESDSSDSFGGKPKTRPRYLPSSSLTTDTQGASTSGYLPQTDESLSTRKKRRTTTDTSGEVSTLSYPRSDDSLLSCRALKKERRVTIREPPQTNRVEMVRATVYSNDEDGVSEEDASSDISTSTIRENSSRKQDRVARATGDESSLPNSDMFHLSNLSPFKAVKKFLTQAKLVGSPDNVWGPSSGEETAERSPYKKDHESEYETGSSTSVAPKVVLHNFPQTQSSASRDTTPDASRSTYVQKSPKPHPKNRSRSDKSIRVAVNTDPQSVSTDSRTLRPHSNATSSSYGQLTSQTDQESEVPSLRVTVNSEPRTLSADSLLLHPFSPAMDQPNRVTVDASSDYSKSILTTVDESSRMDHDGEDRRREHTDDDHESDSDDDSDEHERARASTVASSVSSADDIRALRDVFSEIKHVLIAGINYTKSRLSMTRTSLHPAAGPNAYAQSVIYSCLSRTGVLSESLLPSLVERGNDKDVHSELLVLKQELNDVQNKASELLGIERPTTLSAPEYHSTEDLVGLRREFDRVRMMVEQALNEVIKSEMERSEESNVEMISINQPAGTSGVVSPVIERSRQFLPDDYSRSHSSNIGSVVKVSCYSDEGED